MQTENLPQATPEEKAMTLAFQRGDKGAYQTIHESYVDQVNRICMRMLGKPEDAQEAAQEAMLRVYTGLTRFNGRYRLGAWIARVTTNVCLDQIRARSRRPVVVGPIEELDSELNAIATDSEPEAVVIRNVESRRVKKVLRNLPPMHRAAIMLRDFEGLSYSEVASVLDISECQVKALIHRARKNFRRSWTSVAEMLVPAGLLNRFRNTDVTVKEHAVQTITSNYAPITSACSGALQSCGTFVVDRVMPFAASLVLGGAALASPNADAPSSPVRDSFANDVSDVATERSLRPRTHHERDAKPTVKEPAAAPVAAPVSEEPDAAPPEDRVEEPVPDEGDPGTVDPDATPHPEPTYVGPFLPVFYFDQGQGAPAGNEPVAGSSAVDCDTHSINQRLSTVISDQNGTYPLDIKIKADSVMHMEMTIQKNGFAVYYSGLAPLTGSSESDSNVTLSFTGRYGTGGTAADSAGLPHNGSIRADFTLNCTAQSLAAESIVFTTQ